MMDRNRGDNNFSDPHRFLQPPAPSWTSGDPHAFHPERNFENHRVEVYDNGHHYQQQQQQRPHQFDRNFKPNRIHNNFNGDPNVPIGNCSSEGNTGYDHALPLPARKRQFSHSPLGPSSDCGDNGGFVKLYVGAVPKTATEEDIRSLFGQHGTIVEVVLLKDKRTGLQQECCFVKYAKLEEADRAIGAFHNRYTFPGGVVPIKVRFAEGEQERLGSLGKQDHKLYVGSLNKQASKREVEEIFSAYGFIEDIYLVRDELKQNRGCGFIRFARREMAVAAINALNGTYVMRGCEQPLIVRFADPKKPKTGDMRCTSKFEPTGFGPRFREPVARPASHFGDPIVGHVLPDPSGLASPKSVAPCSQGGPTEVISCPTNAFGGGFPSSSQQSLQIRSKPQIISTTSTVSDLVVPSTVSSATVIPISTQTDLSDCDWSEHTCPDGYKYYYNCINCESRWEKPEEYTLYEQQFKRRQQQHTYQRLHSPSNPKETDHVQGPARPIIAPARV